MAGRVIGIPAVGAKAIMAMTFFVVAVIQAGGVQSAQTIFAATATFVRLDCNAVTILEFGHIGCDGDHRPGEFMARNELTQFGITLPAFGNDGGIASANGNRMDLYQRLAALQDAGTGTSVTRKSPKLNNTAAFIVFGMFIFCSSHGSKTTFTASPFLERLNPRSHSSNGRTCADKLGRPNRTAFE